MREKSTGEVEVGQVWEDRDSRESGRRLKVLEVTEVVAVMQAPSGGRRTRIRLDQLPKRFRLVERAW